MKFDIITFGSATQDVFMSSKNFTEIENEKFDTHKGLCISLGSKMKMDSVLFAMGGVGTNTACTLAEQGLKTAYFGGVGTDPFGESVKNELTKHGVSLDLLRESEEYNTAFSVVLSLPEVGRSILEKYGACHELVEKDLPFGDLKADWFYLGSLSGNSHDMLPAILEHARSEGIKVSSNPAGSLKTDEHMQILKENLDKIDILILNQEECAKLTGVDYKNEKEIFEKLGQMAGGIVVMTKGPDGVVVSDGEKLYSAGIPESDMVERTGAGDAFGSAFTAGYIDTGDISHAIQLGTANATSVLQEMGATNGLLKKGEWGEWKRVDVEVQEM